MTVGELRKALEGVADDVVVIVNDWDEGQCTPESAEVETIESYEVWFPEPKPIPQRKLFALSYPRGQDLRFG